MAKRKDILLLDRPREDAFSDLVGAVYDVALNVVNWPEMLEHLAPFLDATASMLVRYDHNARRGRIQHEFGLGPMSREAYNDTLASEDPWLPQLRFPFRAGWVCPGEDLVDEPELSGTEFYRRWLEPQGLYHAILGVVSSDNDSSLVAVALRPRGATPFGAGEAERFRQILPHMQRGMRIQRSLDHETLERNALLGALDRLQIGVGIVREDCEILIMNKAAREMCGREGGLTNLNNRLGAQSGGDAARLRQAVSIALNAPGGSHSGITRSLSIQRASGLMPLAALIIQVDFKSQEPGTGQRAAAVFIADPERNIDVDQAWLKDLFELTDAEARLASLLVGGFRLDEAATHLGVSLNTVRTHLKRIFSKTGTRRQAELMRLVLTGMTQIYTD